MDYTNLHKCLFSEEFFGMFDKPPKFFNELKNSVKKYVDEYIKNNQDLVKKLDIKDEVTQFKYKTPSNILTLKKTLKIPAISIDLKLFKKYIKENNEVNLFARDINFNFKCEIGKNVYIAGQHPYYTHGNKRLTYKIEYEK